MSRRAKPAKAKSKAKRPVAHRIRDLEKRLADALAQETATGEILRTVRGSPTDTQPVFDAVVRTGARLCEADYGFLARYDGTSLAIVAHFGATDEELEAVLRVYPMAPTPGSLGGRTILERAVVHIPDVSSDPTYEPRALQEAGWRTGLGVPLLREGTAIGLVGMWRRDVRPFGDRQIELLKIFADQAVTAIENVRLFNETKEALEQQTATSEILRVISNSPTHEQPVFDAIVRSARRLCNAAFSVVILAETGQLTLVAVEGVDAAGVAALQRTYPHPIARDTASGRAILDRRVVHLKDSWLDPEYTHPLRDVIGLRSIVTVPIFREGVAIGAVSAWRGEVRPFTDRQIALLKTFAAQAVIAIENVRLFKELQAKNAGLTESLDQQTATGEVLRVISRSPTDVQPVFEAIAESARSLCDGDFSSVARYDGELLHLVAHAETTPEGLEVLQEIFPARPSRATVFGRAVLEGAVVNIPDLGDDAEYEQSLAHALGVRSGLGAPMLREGRPIGVIAVGRKEARAFTQKQVSLLETFAEQAVIAIENGRLFKELEAKNASLTEALEQQTATSDILRVISRSPTDIQPVLDTVVESAARLCQSLDTAIYRLEGDRLVLAAHHGAMSLGPRGDFSLSLSRGTVAGRAVLEGRPVHVADLLTNVTEFPETSEHARRVGICTILTVPLMREGVAVGVISLLRAEPQLFTERQAALLETFAAQAVIAIENVRLFNEIKEALEQQTATAEILRVISSSPTDAQPVFEAIAESAVRLCGAEQGIVTRFDGEWVHIGAIYGPSPAGIDAVRRVYPMRPSGAGGSARAIRDCAVVHIPDILADPEYTIREAALASGFRAVLGIPMLREGRAIGSIAIGRATPGAFSDAEVQLLQTFADQAVIAIENVRLFNETKEALDRQTATSEILRIISSSPADVQPVFDAIIRSAARLCEASFAALDRFDGQTLSFRAHHGATESEVEEVRRRSPQPPARETAVGRAVLDRRVVHIHDIRSDPEYRVTAGQMTFHTALAVPLMREGDPVGAMALWRREVRPFSDNQIELLQTFAEQAVIAIENVRLFKELQERTAQLGRSVDELTALSQVSQALSSTLDIEIVLTTIVSRAIDLSGADGGSVYEYDDLTEEFRLRATQNFEEDLVEASRAMPLHGGGGALGMLAERREPVQIADISDPAVYQSRVRDVLLRTGYRALLAVPLLRDGRIIGGLVIGRKATGEFPPGVVDLLTTFANQSALAIQNARLFREIADKSRQLEVASQHKSEFLANMSHELRTPLNAIIGFSEVLSERMFGELNEKQEEYLKDIHASGQHLLSLINDILDLSKIEAGRMELELTDFQLPAAIDNALTLVRERAGRRGVALHQAVDEQLGQIRGDERKIKQVVLNLLSNALKFTPEGGRIDVRARLVDGMAEISVADTGVGIAPEDQEAIFEEFRQVGTAARQVEGTGLGLALSRKFIELHGGRIWVESQVGAGSRFTFTIPVRPGA